MDLLIYWRVRSVPRGDKTPFSRLGISMLASLTDKRLLTDLEPLERASLDLLRLLLLVLRNEFSCELGLLVLCKSSLGTPGVRNGPEIDWLSGAASSS